MLWREVFFLRLARVFISNDCQTGEARGQPKRKVPKDVLIKAVIKFPVVVFTQSDPASYFLTLSVSRFVAQNDSYRDSVDHTRE